MQNLRVSTIISITLLIAALALAVLGFISASDSAVSPALVTTYMMIAAALFGVLAVIALSRKERWQRFLGVAAATAALYMLVMAIVFFQMLSTIVMPEF